MIAWLVQDIVFCGTARIGVKIWKQNERDGQLSFLYVKGIAGGRTQKSGTPKKTCIKHASFRGAGTYHKTSFRCRCAALYVHNQIIECDPTVCRANLSF